MLAKYRKLIAQIVGAAVAAGVAALTDNTITPTEWVGIGIVAVGAVQVWNAANVPGSPFAKGTASAAAALGVLVTVLPDGITSYEFGLVLVAALTSLGVIGVGNRGDYGDRTGATGRPAG